MKHDTRRRALRNDEASSEQAGEWTGERQRERERGRDFIITSSFPRECIRIEKRAGLFWGMVTVTTHVYTLTRIYRSLSLLAFYPSCRLSRFSSLCDPLCPVSPVLLVLTPAACIRRRRISDVGEERHSHGERETGVGARGNGGENGSGWLLGARVVGVSRESAGWNATAAAKRGASAKQSLWQRWQARC